MAPETTTTEAGGAAEPCVAVQRGVLRLEVGMLVRPSIGGGPYRITSIRRGCTRNHAKGLHDFVLGPDADPEHLPPHLDIECVHVDRPGTTSYLSYYDEATLRSVYPWGRDDDYLIVEGMAGAQLSLL